MTDVLEPLESFSFSISLFQAFIEYVFAYLFIFLLNFERFYSFLPVVILIVSYLALMTK